MEVVPTGGCSPHPLVGVLLPQGVALEWAPDIVNCRFSGPCGMRGTRVGGSRV